jgi:hypothetical protein
MNIHDATLRGALDLEPWPAFIVAAAGRRIVYANPAWDRAAAEAGGPLRSQVIGMWWPGAIAGLELRAWYEQLFARVLAGREEGVLCECNTPARFRLLSLQLDPVGGRGAEASGVIMRARLIREAPIAERYPVAGGPRPGPRDGPPSGRMVQCSCCRRVPVVGTSPRRWELVPQYLARPLAAVSHRLCERCRNVYYGPCGGRPGVGDGWETTAVS